MDNKSIDTANLIQKAEELIFTGLQDADSGEVPVQLFYMEDGSVYEIKITAQFNHALSIMNGWERKD